jgi:hypothetical protein
MEGSGSRATLRHDADTSRLGPGKRIGTVSPSPTAFVGDGKMVVPRSETILMPTARSANWFETVKYPSFPSDHRKKATSLRTSAWRTTSFLTTASFASALRSRVPLPRPVS